MNLTIEQLVDNSARSGDISPENTKRLKDLFAKLDEEDAKFVLVTITTAQIVTIYKQMQADWADLNQDFVDAIEEAGNLLNAV